MGRGQNGSRALARVKVTGKYQKEKKGAGFEKYEGRQEELMVNYEGGGGQGRGEGEKYIAS